MKKTIFLMTLVWLVSTTAFSAPLAVATPGTTTPNTRAINLRIINTMQLIAQDRSSGKITKAQAASLWTQMHTILQQLVAYHQAGNMADLTSTQYSNLNQLLDNLNASL